MSGFLGWVGGIVLLWAWLCPHDLGRWIEKVKDPYRQKPIHQRNKN